VTFTKGSHPPDPVARGLRLQEKAADVASIRLPIEPRAVRAVGAHEVLVRIEAAAVNPSDVKAATGLMPYAVFPRTPGRDYAGVVLAGSPELVGKAVFGSSGDLGIKQDGSHATHMLVEAAAVVEVPNGVELSEAAGIGVPFVTACEGFRRSGPPGPGETVLVLGANGKVGQAAIQIGTWRGARVIGVVRNGESYVGHTSAPVAVIDSSTTDVPARVRELTDGHGADIVFNTVGDPYYEIARKSLAALGRQILISAVHRIVAFDILPFYKGRHAYFGIDTISLGSIESGEILRQLVPGFVSGHLKPFPIGQRAIYPLEEALDAYQAVANGTPDRIILKPSA
jgi:NADPH:quinone reductase